MRLACTLLIVGSLAVGGCGDDEDDVAPATAPQPSATVAPTSTAVQRERSQAAIGRGTRIVAARSPFGRMLYDAKRQAIYIFENDRKGTSVCYGACAEAWPPVYTDGAPIAAGGVRGSLLGTLKRRDGRRQVTYAGQPLYYYAHEAPGEVRCHNVDLNGGLWWVVGPDGRRRP